MQSIAAVIVPWWKTNRPEFLVRISGPFASFMIVSHFLSVHDPSHLSWVLALKNQTKNKQKKFIFFTYFEINLNLRNYKKNLKTSAIIFNPKSFCVG